MKTEKQIYRYSRIALFFISLLIFEIMFINEDISAQQLGLVFAVITYLISFISGIFCKKLISYGDKKTGKRRVFFYIALPLASIIITFLYLVIGLTIVEPMVDSIGGWDGLGLALFFYLTVILIGIIVIAPSLQALIVLALRKLLGEKR